MIEAPWLGCINYEIGMVHSALEAGPSGFEQSKAAELLLRGAERYGVITEPLLEPLTRCISQTLEQTAVPLDAVGSVIFASESFAALAPFDLAPDAFRASREVSFDLVVRLGLHKASVSAVTFGGCTNLAQLILQATAATACGSSGAALIVVFEQHGSLQDRLMNEAMALSSDAVASCLLRRGTGDSGPGFQIRHTASAVYRRYGADGIAHLMLEMFRAMRNAAADCYDASGLQPRDFRWLVLGNYNRATSLTHGRLLGFPPERIFLDNVGRFGHVPFDVLIGLDDLWRSGAVAPGDHVLAFMCGPISCTGLVVEVA